MISEPTGVPDAVLGVAVVTALVALMVVGARRLQAGHGGWAWLVGLPLLLGSAGIIAISVQQLARGQMIGIPLLGLGLVLGLVDVRYVSAISRRITATPPGGDISGAFSEPMADHAVTRVAVGLIISILLGIGFIIWAVVQRLT